MAKKGFAFSENDLISKGYVKDENGNFIPPKLRKEPISQNKPEIGGNLIERKPIQTPNFEASVKTEWFIQGYSVPSKKNSRQNFVKNGKQISIPSKKHAEYVKMTAMQYSVFGNEFKAAVKHYNLTYPLQVEFTFIRSTKHSFDYCNACQTCEDIMKGHWIPDDDADHIIPVFKPYRYDKNNPGVIIKLLL